MNKRVLIVLLVGVNVLLLAGLLCSVYTPPSAFAQAAAAKKGEIVLIAARAEVGNDAVYMLDAGGRQLHGFRTTFPRVAGQPTQIRHVGSRDLARDFPNAAGGR